MSTNKKKSKSSAGILKIIALLIAIVLTGGFLVINWYNNSIYSLASNIEDDVEVIVSEGDNFISLIPQLKEKGLISSEEAIKIYLRLNNISPNIKAGTYFIPFKINVPTLIETLEKGVFKSSVLVTLREGLRLEESANILNTKFSETGEQKKFDTKEFIDICKSPDEFTFSNEVQAFLTEYKPSGKSLEGFLFPETYRFDVDATAQVVIERLIITLKEKLEENSITTAGSKSVDNFYEALTLASILEKEASFSDDVELISGIFHNRLAQNYPLQADSTVNFITGKNDPGVLISDTKIDSPYNTYKYPGLPPTPINSPGLKTLKAALSPKTTDYFFFVHDANGKSYFAVTFEEHQRNIQRYL